jgi:hypothetical protein
MFEKMPLPSQNILKKELLFLFQIIREKSKTIRFFLRIKIIFMKLNANCFRLPSLVFSHITNNQ